MGSLIVPVLGEDAFLGCPIKVFWLGVLHQVIETMEIKSSKGLERDPRRGETLKIKRIVLHSGLPVKRTVEGRSRTKTPGPGNTEGRRDCHCVRG